jgi:hypothetical protein
MSHISGRALAAALIVAVWTLALLVHVGALEDSGIVASSIRALVAGAR